MAGASTAPVLKDDRTAQLDPFYDFDGTDSLCCEQKATAEPLKLERTARTLEPIQSYSECW